jgi:hypothetical protein
MKGRSPISIFIFIFIYKKKSDLELLTPFLEGMGREELLGRRIYVCVQFMCVFFLVSEWREIVHEIFVLVEKWRYWFFCFEEFYFSSQEHKTFVKFALFVFTYGEEGTTTLGFFLYPNLGWLLLYLGSSLVCWCTLRLSRIITPK